MCERKGSQNEQNIKENKCIGKFQVKLRMNRTNERMDGKAKTKRIG